MPVPSGSSIYKITIWKSKPNPNQTTKQTEGFYSYGHLSFVIGPLFIIVFLITWSFLMFHFHQLAEVTAGKDFFLN